MTTVDRDESAPVAAAFGLGLALLAGGIVRVLPMSAAGFPLNDGGLFATMIGDLIANGLLLPASTSYNGLSIPFAYPPLAFYVAAIANQAFGIAVADALRLFPFLFSLLMIPALYWLALGILGSRSGAVLAALAFALVPGAYVWMITGGGVTRALGFLLAIVALGIAWRLLRSPQHRWWTAAMLGLVGGLTTLAHPQAGVFMTVSILVFLPWAHTWRAAAVRVVLAGTIGLVVIVPWLFAVLSHHGLDPLVSAFSSGGGTAEGVLTLLAFRFTEMALFDVIGVAGLMGAFIAVRQREFVLPLWLVAIWVIDSRAGSTYSMVPLSMLAAYALLSVTPHWLPVRGVSPLRAAARAPWRVAGGLVVLIALVVGNYVSALSPFSPLFPLSADGREAMTWTAQRIANNSIFAVITGTNTWEVDATSEWFPTLTGDRSAATVQGHEWLGSEAWTAQQEAYFVLQICARDTLPCVVRWAETHGVPISYVYLPKGQLHGPLSAVDCCLAPRHSVGLVPGAHVIYDGPGATIIELP